MISRAWKAAITILALRYLYFGRPNLAPQSQIRTSPTPSFATRAGSSSAAQHELGAYHHNIEDFDLSEFVDESAGEENLPDYLTAGLYLNDPLSRSPSPMPSPLPYTEPPASNLWDTRYEIHDEAFTVLSTNFIALHDDLDPVCLRYILVPLLILSLVSRPNSDERALCLSYFAKFKAFMAGPSESASAGSPAPVSPIGGEELELDISWEKLDAYSEIVDRERRENLLSTNVPMDRSAPEWNWWDMLKHIDLNLACK